MNRWKTALLLPLSLLLGGCVTYPTYSYRDGTPVRDTHYVGDDTYYSPANGDYGDYYSSSYRYGSGGYRYYAPDYVSYSAYYSLFWPLHRWYHDPYWYPDFHYGVTYFPRNYFSVSFHSGWRGHSLSHWGYGSGYSIALGYSHWYSPYRYSWVDSYYDWDRYRFHYRENRQGHGNYAPAYSQPRFGNARNAAERLASRERERSAPRGDGIATGLGVPAVRAYDGGRAPSRGADYGRRGDTRLAPASAPITLPGPTMPAREVGSGSGFDRREQRSAPVRTIEGGRRGLGDRGPDSQGLALPATPRSEAPALQSAPARVYEDTPDARDRYRSRDFRPAEDYRQAPRISMPAREYREPQQQFAPAQRFEPAAPRGEFRTERGGRGSDFGGRSVDVPAPRVESPRQEMFRNTPSEIRSEPAPRFDGSGREQRGDRESSRAREALPFD
ncbi:hypothetical protein [Aquimonas voraii]|uniref:YXWGXW repeat-containing protein n=1 Tax=Aquimonas voraii TaxID=265719 RepID=A0A1G6X742_9GAMM|nr:hypothetical protein [Aquimonas voraii]SDD73894.1 hypothetical protein SAMN04488509_10670 [Aquimonas voraii]